MLTSNFVIFFADLYLYDDERTNSIDNGLQGQGKQKELCAESFTDPIARVSLNCCLSEDSKGGAHTKSDT